MQSLNKNTSNLFINTQFKLLSPHDPDEYAGAEAVARRKQFQCIEDYIECALSVRSVIDLQALVIAIMSNFGYTLLGANLTETKDDITTIHMLNAGHKDITDYYLKNLLFHDDSISYCNLRLLPRIWVPRGGKASQYQSTPKMQVALNRFEMGTTLILPMHDPNRFKSGFRFCTQLADKFSREDCVYSMSSINLLCTYLHQALVKLVRPQCSHEIHLTVREKDILKWVANGKCTWSISDELKISENTVLYHMKNIHRKLNVNSRNHAVAKALQLKLI